MTMMQVLKYLTKPLRNIRDLFLQIVQEETGIVSIPIGLQTTDFVTSNALKHSSTKPTFLKFKYDLSFD